MDGLVSLLVFSGIFYFLMRFGCGAHMVAGGHGKHGHKNGVDVKHVDPVCGMQISPDEGYGKMHDGRLFRFCSRNCLDKFEEQPDRFLNRESETMS